MTNKRLRTSSSDFDQPRAEPDFSHVHDARPVLPVCPNSKPIAIEIFAGSARVTAFLRHLGMSDSFGVDHILGKSAGKVVLADLRSESGQELCFSWVKSPSCIGIFAAPPCGTCSRARELPLRLPSGEVVRGPPPLRSPHHPDGLPGLSGTNLAKVSSANCLYAFLTSIALWCCKNKKIVCIENPKNSLYWRTSFFAPLTQLLAFTVHQACAYGSERPKQTALAHNHAAFAKINKLCPGESPSHKHKPWGLVDGAAVFATKEETAYPLPLAYEIAFAIASCAVAQGWQPPQSELRQPQSLSYHHLRAIVGTQPKASKIAPVVAEFARIVMVPLAPTEAPPVPMHNVLQEEWRGVPPGSKLIRSSLNRLNGEFGPQPLDCETPQNYCTFGIFRSPEAFVQYAVQVGHPINLANCLPQVLADALADSVRLSPKDLMQARSEKLKSWIARARELRPQEDALHKSLPSHAQLILAPKRILLWKSLLEEFGYPDPEVVDEVVNGTELTGQVPFVPCFDLNFRPASSSVDNLKRNAGASNQAIFHSVRSSGDDFIDSEVYRETIAELESGWLVGPFAFDDLPEGAVLSRRFGIKQSSGEKVKVRLIDDLSASGINSTVQVQCMPKLHTLDVVASVALELTKSGRTFDWLGKTFDLASAYRQLALSSNSLWASFVVCFNPEHRKPEIFAMRALPFGASRSVYSFLRVSRSLWWLGCKALSLVWSSFFDDFITFARRAEAEPLNGAVHAFFRILGWEVSGEGKDQDFSSRFSALGIEVSLDRFGAGVVEFSNTPKRVNELSETIKQILDAGSMSQALALSLRGRMQFAKAQLWGRASKLCLNAVTSHAYKSDSAKLDEKTVDSLKHFLACLQNSPPKLIGASWSDPLYLFTDASFSPESDAEKGRLGAVLVDHVVKVLSFYSKGVDAAVLEVLGFPQRRP